MRKNILWVINKYNFRQNHERYYLNFLESVVKDCSKLGVNLILVRFDNFNMSTKHVLFPKDEIKPVAYKKVSEIESEYGFTFRALLYPDLIQLNRSNWNIDMDENLFQSELLSAASKFVWLEQYILKNKIDLIFADQSPEYEISFAKYIGISLGIRTIRSMEGSFFGRTVFVENRETYNKDLGIVKLFLSMSVREEEKRRVLNYSSLNQAPYKITPQPLTSNIFSLRRILLTGLRKFQKKKFYQEIPDNYVFFSPHLLRESTLHYRATHFSNQTSLIEIIARVLPADLKLVVREHPHWHDRYPKELIKTWSSIPNVVVISPKLSIHNIISRCKAVLTINSTTGLEACAYKKPVITFIPTIYDVLSNVALVRELHELPKMLVKESNLLDSEWEEYVDDMLSNTIDFGFNSFTFSSSNYQERSRTFANILNSITHEHVNI